VHSVLFSAVFVLFSTVFVFCSCEQPHDPLLAAVQQGAQRPR
jgi:hypothetical protein